MNARCIATLPTVFRRRRLEAWALGIAVSAVLSLGFAAAAVAQCTIVSPKDACEGSLGEFCGPMGDFTYDWTLPDGSKRSDRCFTIAALVESRDQGTYRLTITNRTTGARSSCSRSLDVHSLPRSRITAPAEVCQGARVELCGPDGSNFSYSWVFPDGSRRTTRCVTISAASAVDAGVYTLTVLDAITSCSSTSTHTLNVASAPCGITGPAAVCVGAPIELCGPMGDFTYQWTFPNGTVRTTQCINIPAATLANAGTYKLKVVGAKNSCPGTCTHKLVVGTTPPACSISGPTAVCEGAAAELCGPDGNLDYEWTLPNGTKVTTRCVTIAAAGQADGGDYRLRVTDRVGGCTSTCVSKLDVNPRPPCAIEGPTTACIGAPVELCGPAGNLAYLWTLPDGSTRTGRCIQVGGPPPGRLAAGMIRESEAAPGIFTLRVTDLVTGCTRTCEHRLSLVQPPPCAITAPKSACAGSAVELCGPEGAFTYQWTLPGGATRASRCVTIAAVSTANAGVYTLVVTDPVTGCVTTCSHSLRVDTPPPFKINAPSSICFGMPVELCAPEGYDYRWTLPNASTSTSRCITIAAAAQSHSGLYRLVVRDRESGCTSTGEQTMTVLPPTPCAITAPKSVCLGSPLELCGPGGNLLYRWTLPDGSERTSRCVTITSAATRNAGVYRLVVTDLATGCTSSCSHGVAVDLPTCSITGPTMVCEGTPVQLCGPSGSFSYLWTLPDATTRTSRCVSITSATVRDAGVYTLRVTDTVTGCIGTCDQKLGVNAAPCTITGPTAVCPGDPLELCGPDGNYTYLWTLPNGTTRSVRCVTIPAAGSGDHGLYALVVTNPATGCVSRCDRKVAVSQPPPCVIKASSAPGAPAAPSFACEGASVDLCGPTGGYTYLWTLPNATTRTTQCVAIASAGTGDEGLYTLRVTDAATGCATTCTHRLTVTPIPCRIDGPVEVAAGETAELCGPDGGFTYLWTLPDRSTRTSRCVKIENAGPANAGSYSLRVTDPVTGCSKTCERELRVRVECKLVVTKTAKPDVITSTPPPSCETIGKLTSLTFVYTGRNCSATSHRQAAGKVICNDLGPSSEPVQVVYTGSYSSKYSVTPGGQTLRIGDRVTLTAIGTDRLATDTKLEIRVDGKVSQRLTIHTSCSQPLAVGDVFGALDLVAMNGQSGTGQDVTYDYVVTNDGSPLVDLSLVDDQLGTIAAGLSLPTGSSRSFSRTVKITATTTNTVVASGRLVTSSGPECRASAQATVTVVPAPRTCEDGKPTSLTFEYTGQTCAASRHSQPPDKATCEDKVAMSEPVQIVYTGRDPSLYTVVPSGETVRIGDRITFSRVGGIRLGSDSQFEIRRGGKVLQVLGIHTSCSQPLRVGDQFGSLILREFVPVTAATATSSLESAPQVGSIEEAPKAPAGVATFGLRVSDVNRASGTSHIDFSITREGATRLTVHDVQGRMLGTLARGRWPAGDHRVAWDPDAQGRGLSSGIYFIRLEAAEGVLTRKIVLIRR